MVWGGLWGGVVGLMMWGGLGCFVEYCYWNAVGLADFWIFCTKISVAFFLLKILRREIV